jgi:hypothetical protein
VETTTASVMPLFLDLAADSIDSLDETEDPAIQLVRAAEMQKIALSSSVGC